MMNYMRILDVKFEKIKLKKSIYSFSLSYYMILSNYQKTGGSTILTDSVKDNDFNTSNSTYKLIFSE